MRYLLFLLALPILAQPQYHIYVAANPSGSCAARSIPRITLSTGAISTCAGGTWSVTGTVSPTGTVTNVTGTAPIAVATGTTTPVVSINDTAVTPGSYTSANLTVDAKGRITAASNGVSAVPGSAVPGTSTTLSGNAQIYICTGTCTITVPVPALNVQYCVLNDDNVATVITLSAIGSSARYENTARTAYGTAGTGTLVSGGAVGDMVCILGRDTTHYLTTSFTGTWTAN